VRNKNNIALTVGIGIFGVFAILIAWAAGTADNPEVTQGKGVKLAAAADTSYCTILLLEAISRFEADGTNGYVTVKPGKQAERLSVGQYHIRFWKTERKDDGGNTWALADHYFGQDKPFEIKDGDETKLDVGEPIIATVNARNVGSGYAFNQVISGRAIQTAYSAAVSIQCISKCFSNQVTKASEAFLTSSPRNPCPAPLRFYL
jgi:hypothetical protein